MTGSGIQTCNHCGIGFRWKPETIETDDGTIKAFCCRGCRGAFELINSSGLSDFYRRMDLPPPTATCEVRQYPGTADLAKHITPDGDLCRIGILIGGIRCPSCIWLLEHLLARIDGVHQAAISYTDNRASIAFDPAKAEPTVFFTTASSAT